MLRVGWKVFDPLDPFKTRLRIIRADPRVLIGRDVVAKVMCVKRDQLALDWSESPWVAIKGDVLRIEAFDQAVVYRLVKYLPESDGYIAVWPD